MKRRLVIVTEIISPYRIPLFNALAEHPDVDLHVIFLAETDPTLRQWRVYKEEIRFSYQVLPSWRKQVGRHNVLLNRGIGAALAGAAPKAILCGGYNYVASWQSLCWARQRNVPFLLWSESNLYEMRRHNGLTELLKSEFVSRCAAFVVPGTWGREYLQVHKVNEEVIFTAPNAVDNDFFSCQATIVRQNPASFLRELGLPDRYFLFVGRLVREKGVFELLSAYEELDEQVRCHVGLVFVGDGSCRADLQQRAASISTGLIKFSGFAHREELAAYYALAEMLILPTYSDTWGLVVNEAMACGLPVILSRAAGCNPDLVKENWNGLSIAPRDVPSLTLAMHKLATDADLRVTMGSHSCELISRYSPKEWSNSIAGALRMTVGARD